MTERKANRIDHTHTSTPLMCPPLKPATDGAATGQIPALQLPVRDDGDLAPAAGRNRPEEYGFTRRNYIPQRSISSSVQKKKIKTKLSPLDSPIPSYPMRTVSVCSTASKENGKLVRMVRGEARRPARAPRVRLCELCNEPRYLRGGLRKLREPQASTGGCVLTSKQARNRR